MEALDGSHRYGESEHHVYGDKLTKHDRWRLEHPKDLWKAALLHPATYCDQVQLYDLDHDPREQVSSSWRTRQPVCMHACMHCALATLR